MVDVWETADVKALSNIQPYLEGFERDYGALNAFEVSKAVVEGKYRLLFIGCEGFAIIEPQGERVHVVAAAAFKGSADAKVFDSFESFARDEGFKMVTFTSPRAGWMRTAKNRGFTALSVKYGKEL